MLPSLPSLPNFDASLTGLLAVSFFPFSTSKHFQSLMVSSAAALATVVLSGDIVKHSTLAVWPIHSSKKCLNMDPYYKIHKLKCNCKRDRFDILRQSSKWTFELTGPKQILEFIIFIYLNKNWKIYWSEQSVTDLGSEDQCSSWGLLRRTVSVIIVVSIFKNSTIMKS